MTREEAKAVVEKLVNRFAEQRNGYHAADYNETKTRRDFIDPLFTAFGWDMDNKDDVAEPYREVIHEDKVKIQGKTKAPDYGFRLSGSKDRLFFVEAKKPSVALKTNKEAAFQVRRYGWNSGASVSILTNFEEFIIYDCSKKPSSTESSAVARLKYFTYDQLLNEFDFFYDIFSREAVVKGRFDKYIQSDTAKKGTQTPDKDFVVSLDKWRKFIAIDIAKNNLKLNEDELNFAVQLIIDRLIFLRFCEDRGVETYGQLKTAASKGDAYKNLCGVFKDADNKYNSGLFDYKKDQITQDLKVTNKIIKGIIEDLYYPKSEYDFKALPVEVLGNAYEQFLGKVITINRAHHAVIDYKPEVRKAGGVYYTPQYIVDYIVENTLGKLIKGKTPKEIEKIKIVDPACGSGSFLLGAFQYLLNFHAEYYHKNGYANKKGKDNPLTPFGTLSTAEKKNILISNIYGVDIDANAVEVTKLSLLLKCMEGETDASIKMQMEMFKERVLPDLDNNIKDGNSLIDTDIYDNEFDLGFEKKIKPFSWKKNFPEVFKQGGFSAIIGNPPYVDSRVNEEQTKDYWKTHYFSSKYGKTNTYEIFIEKGLKLLMPKGELGFIVPVVILTLDACKGLRELLINNYSITELSYGDFAVFADANVDTVVILAKNSREKDHIAIKKFSNRYASVLEEHSISSTSLDKTTFKIALKTNFITDKIQADKSYIKISDLVDFYNGIATGPDKEKYFSQKKLNSKYKPLLMGNNIGYYSTNYEGRFINYDRPKLHRPREEKIFLSKEKIIMQRIRNLKLKRRLVCTLDTQQFYTFNSVNNLLLKSGVEYDLRYILALLNSNLLNYLLKQYSLNTNITLSDLESLPIKPINFKKSVEKKSHDEIVKQVNQLLFLNEELISEKLQTKVEQLKRRAEHCEEKINQLIYQLYELTPAEINIIEETDKV